MDSHATGLSKLSAGSKATGFTKIDNFKQIKGASIVVEEAKESEDNDSQNLGDDDFHLDKIERDYNAAKALENYQSFGSKLEKALKNFRFKKYAGKIPKVKSPTLFDLQVGNPKKCKSPFPTIT
jgi:hypothetical protein